jgi:hypothetical protein
MRGLEGGDGGLKVGDLGRESMEEGELLGDE